MKSPFRFDGIITLVGLAAWACAGGDVASPARAVRGPSLSQAASVGTPGPKDPFVKCRPDGAFQGSADIGPAGGRLVVGHNRLIVPAGALSQTVHIVATAPGDTLAFVAFEPSGLVFNKQARLVLDVRNCDLGWPGARAQWQRVVYVDDDFNIKEWIGAHHDWRRQTVSAAISHFSGYAVAW